MPERFISVYEKSLPDSLSLSEKLTAARNAGVPFQREILQFGGTDTAALQRTGAGVPAGAVSIATRYIHSPSEMCAARDVEQAAALLAEAVCRTL